MCMGVDQKEKIMEFTEKPHKKKGSDKDCMFTLVGQMKDTPKYIVHQCGACHRRIYTRKK